MKTILITGSTRGIGFAMAKHFLQSGHRVVINGTSKQSVEKALSKLKEFENNRIGVSGDVREKETLTQLQEQGLKAFGKIDIWINNAGIPQENDFFGNLNGEKIKKVLDVNIWGLILGTKEAISFFENQGYGKLFNMEGFGADGRMMDKMSIYGTTKRAVNYFTQSVAKENKNSAIHVGILSPGMVRTDFLNVSMDSASEKEKKRFEKVYRILAEEPDVVAQFLCERILGSSKNNDHIRFLSGFRLASRLIKLMFSQ